MTNFTHLHVHSSQGSMLDSVASVKSLVAAAKENGMDSLALTDHGTMYGIIAFYKECQKQGIKPIIGCEVYVTNDDYSDGEPKKKTRDNYHLILLAENDTGYQNLCKIVSEATEHMYYKPRATKQMLRKYHEGLIALTACIGGEVCQAIKNGGIAVGRKIVEEYIDIFGRDNLFLEIQKHDIPEEASLYTSLVKIASEMDMPLVATNDIHYIKREDARTQEIVFCIRDNTTMNDPNRYSFGSDQCYFRTGDEMMEIFGDYLGCLSNTRVIAKRCNVEIKFKQNLSPKYPAIPDGETDTSYLRRICEEAIERKYPTKEVSIEAARKRMDYELGIIDKMHYSSYFLIVADFIRYAHEHDIAIGPGRGSGAGSIVCYLTGITRLEPMGLNLLFERFLNPDRQSMPDIDTDIADYGRDEIAEYMMDFYKRPNSAKIVTFQTMKAKAAIKNAAKALNEPFSVGKELAGYVADNQSIEEALETNEEFHKRYEEDSDSRAVVDAAKAIEDLPRQKGSHAAGIVISAVPLKEALPISLESDGWRTEYDKDEVEQLGLLKMDLLGLVNLSIIRDCVKAIKERTGKDIDLEYETMPLDDAAVADMLCKGGTFGVFQMESAGMTELVKKLQPRTYRDLVPLVALYRPGPLGSGMVDDFVECRHGRQEIKYMHPWLEPILKETYGIILYQEQVMQIVQKLGNFTLGEADLMRRAMGHKEPELLMAQEDKFVKGCLENHIDEALSRKIFQLMLQFASYGFNKSHSAAYAFVAYQTAYLKAHYPCEYMAAYMSHIKAGKPEVKAAKLATAKRVCDKYHIKFLGVDVNKSVAEYRAEGNNNIRIGFSAIKGIGDNVIATIVREREENGAFVSPTDFLFRVPAVGKEAFFALARLGAFNGIFDNQSILCTFYSDITDAVKKVLKDKAKAEKNEDTNSLSLFGEDVLDALEVKPPTVKEILSKGFEMPLPYTPNLLMESENELYSFYATKNPLDDFRQKYIVGVSTDVSFMIDATRNGKWQRDWIAKECGMFTALKPITTKKGERMAFGRFQTYSECIDVVIFPEAYEKMREQRILSKLVYFIKAGTPSMRNGKFQLIINEIEALA